MRGKGREFLASGAIQDLPADFSEPSKLVLLTYVPGGVGSAHTVRLAAVVGPYYTCTGERRRQALAKPPADNQPPASSQASGYLSTERRMAREAKWCCQAFCWQIPRVRRDRSPVSMTACLLHGRACSSGPRFPIGSAATCKLVGMDRSPVAVAFAASTGAGGQKAGVTLEPTGLAAVRTWATIRGTARGLDNESDTSRPLVTWAGP